MTGSTGYGDASIFSLLGRIGTNDVQDLLQALLFTVQHVTSQHLLEKAAITDSTAFALPAELPRSLEGMMSPLIDVSRVGIVGGSHGGFLTAHCCGQHPGIFKAAAVRNPVIDLASMLRVTDIPDWCFTESLPDLTNAQLKALLTSNPSPEQLQQLARSSPSYYIDGYKAPTLICLGMKDRRVPASQGMLLLHLLKARDVTCKLLSFPEDVHAIDLPISETEHWIAIMQWMATHLRISKKI
jgi:acylaminoacyl-peptidase